jgi:RNA polymerase sigma-70 factor (ECF subfamily)
MQRPLQLVASDGVAVRGPMSEAQSFEEFFEAESRMLFRRLCLVTGNRHEAEEVMQDAFLKVFERWTRVRTMDDPTGYLYRTAFNVFNKRSRRAALALRKTLRLAPSEDEFAAADARSMIAAGLAKLTPRQRAAVVLTELLGYSSESAADVLGVRPVTVRVLASQGRATMKRTLEHRDD